MKHQSDPRRDSDLFTTDKLDKALQNPEKVQTLYLAYQKLTALPEGIGQMVNLEKIHLEHNHFADLDAVLKLLGRLPRLTYLSITLHDATEVPESIGGLRQLDDLILGGSKCSALPAEFGELSALKTLQLWVHEWLGDQSHLQALAALPQLEWLDLECLHRPPLGFGHLKQVKDLSCRFLPYTPKELAGMASLQGLTLSYQFENHEPIADLRELDQIPSLKALRVRTHAPKLFPKSLRGLHEFQVLDLANGNLDGIPAVFAELRTIRELHFAGNKLSQLPDWIGDWKELKILDLKENQLSALPATLQAATALQEILMDENQFEVFPEVLLRMPSLETISLGKNKIATVADSKVDLPNLKSIQLHLNKLTAFPWVLADAPLAKIDLEGNPFVKSAGYKLDEVVAKVSAETHDAATRQTLLALAIGDVPKALEKASLETLITGLNHAEAKVRAFAIDAVTQFLPDPFAADALPTSIRIVGQSKSYALPEFKKQLEAHKVKVNKAKPGETEIVVLAEKPGEEGAEYLKAGAKPASIVQLAGFVEALAQPWLRTRSVEKPALADNIRKLLDTGTVENFRLAMEMMIGGGVPEGLISEVLAISFFFPDEKLRKQATKAVDTYATPALKAFLAANKRNVLKMYMEKLVPHLEHLMRFEGIDARGFSKTLAALDDDFNGLFMPYMTGLEIKKNLVKKGTLTFDKLPFAGIPPGVFEMEKLHELELTDLKIKEVPTGIERVPNLVNLKLSGNRLNTLPDRMAALTTLDYLKLDDNAFTEIPEVLAKLPKLRILSISNNPLKRLPDFFAELGSLRILSMCDTDLVKFPTVLFQLTQLKILILACYDEGKTFSEVPAGIRKMKGLKDLNLHGQNIQSLPAELAELPLEELDLSGTLIKELPAWLAKMQTLKVLDLENCTITTLPDNFGELSNLESLKLEGARIDTLPDSFVKLKSLKVLSLPDVAFKDESKTITLLKKLPALETISCDEYPNKGFMAQLKKALPKVEVK